MEKDATQSSQPELAVSAKQIERSIFVLRDQKVILEADLADL